MITAKDDLVEVAKQARHAIVIARQRGQCLDEPYATLIDDLTAALAAAGETKGT